MICFQQSFPMNFVDEQSGERCHKIYKYVRRHLARQTSPEDNLFDLMKTALARSDPKIASLVVQNTSSERKMRRDDEFERKLKEYTVNSAPTADSLGDYADHCDWDYNYDSDSDTDD